MSKGELINHVLLFKKFITLMYGSRKKMLQIQIWRKYNVYKMIIIITSKFNAETLLLCLKTQSLYAIFI